MKIIIDLTKRGTVYDLEELIEMLVHLRNSRSTETEMLIKIERYS